MIAVSQSILESLAPIVRPAGALGGGALSPKIGRRRSFSRENLSLTQRHEPGTPAVRHTECAGGAPLAGPGLWSLYGRASIRRPGGGANVAR